MSKIPGHYSLVKEHPESFEIHDARDGKRFHVAKDGLEPAHKKEIAGIQMFADGSVDGPVEPISDSGDKIVADLEQQAANQDSPPQVETTPDPTASDRVSSYVNDAVPSSMVDALAQETQPGHPLSGPPAETVPEDKTLTMNDLPSTFSTTIPRDPSVAGPVQPGMPNTNQSSLALLQADRNAMLGGADAEAKIGAMSNAALTDYQKQRDIDNANFLAQQTKLNKQSDEFMNQMRSQKIDPDHYWSSKSTGSKIATAIGIALSGIGSGLSGQPNLAIERINKAIEKDIDAQKAEQDKTMNLYRMNREALGNAQAAHIATQTQLLGAARVKMEMAANSMAGPLARAKLAPALAQIDQQIVQLNTKQTMLNLAGNGGMTSMDPEKLVPYLVPAEHQKQAITEISQAKAANQNQDAILKNFDQAAKDTRFATGHSGTALLNTLPGYAPPSVKALNLLYDPLIHDNEGRINELEQKHVQSITPQWGDSDETVAKKREALQEFINHKKQATTANAFGINTERFSSTSSNPLLRLPPQQQSYAKWALANKSDPRSSIVLQKLGIQ